MTAAVPPGDSPVQPHYALLGTRVGAFTVESLTAAVARLVARRERGAVLNHNLHGVVALQGDSRVKALYERAVAVHADGMSLVLVARMLGYPLARRHRVTYVDWLPHLMDAAARGGWRVFFVGSAPGVGDRAAARLRERHPGLQLAVHHGYFDARPGSPGSEGVLAAMREAAPDVVLVGMGVPRQEIWIHEHFDRLPGFAILNCGAAMDYVAGAIPTPPRWAGRLGLEWLFRLLAEPGRLWRRYLVEPWRLAPLLLRDLRAAAARRRPPQRRTSS